MRRRRGARTVTRGCRHLKDRETRFEALLRLLARMRFTISVVLVRRWVIALLAVALTAADGCGGDQRLPARTLTIATGTSGGVYDVYGRAIARAVTAYLPDLQ